MDDEPLIRHFKRSTKTTVLGNSPRQQEEMVPRNFFFGKGSQVEVRSEDEGFKGSWYAATVLESDRNTPPPSSSSGKKKRKMLEPEPVRFFVEYDTLVEEEGRKNRLKEYVDGACIRPVPPATEAHHEYELKDVVDVFYRDGWWTGVIVGVLDDEGSKFSVFFENPPEKAEFARSDLRVHHDWVDNEWVRAEKKLQEIIEPDNAVRSQDSKRERRKKRRTESPIGLVNGEEKNGAESTSYEMVVKDCVCNDGEGLTLAGIYPQGIPILNHGYPSQLPHRQYNIMDNILDFCSPIDNQMRETIAGKSGRKPRSCKLKRRYQRSRTNNKSPTQDSQGQCREKPSEQFEDPQLMWYDSNTQEACIEKASNESEGQEQMKKKKSKDRPQLMGREGMNSPYSVDDSKTSFDLNVVQSADAGHGQDESSMRSPTIATCDSIVSENDFILPFEKRSPAWATLERMEIFQKMPQKPHFSPLVELKEDSREGLALAQMVIFSNVVEKTSKLRFSDPRSIIDHSLETLSDLETHGFDVQPVRRRLKELLSKKENQGHLLEKSKELKMKIAEQRVEKVKLGEEICEITKKIAALQEKLSSAQFVEKTTDNEIDTYISNMNVIDEDVQNAQRDFERLAAAPW